MANVEPQSLQARVVALISSLMESLSATVRNQFNQEPPSAEPTSETSPLSSSNTSRDFRKIQMPTTRIGLGSTEGDLLVLVKKYLEIVGLVFFVWLLGYFRFSVSWILLAVFIYLFRQRQRSQFKERHKMLSEINNNEERYIKARLDELPSWVFFPDVERAEWLNRIIKQAWPYANQYLDQEIFRKILIPLIRSTSPALSDFSFDKLDLGEQPPRIGGVKVYTDNVRDQIMMDMEVFYAGDARVKAKVKGIVCGIKDIQFIGDIRIILSPLINTIPLVGAVTYYFLKKPSIDFKLTDAGTLVDIPGLNDLMLVQINEIVASMMVLPNRQVFQLVNDIQVSHLRWSNPQGIVRVFIIKARDLIKADITLLGKGKSDPFVRVKAQGAVEYKTKTISNSVNPEWNEVHEFPVELHDTDAVEFEIFDEDPGKDDFIGRAQFPVNALLGKGPVDTWLTLKDVKKGSLNVRLQYFTLTTERTALDIMSKANRDSIRQEKLSKALLVCFIDRCTNLPRSRKTRREPNPLCRIRVEATEIKTAALESQTNPKFEHVSQFLCVNPLHEKLKIEVCDARHSDVIAYFEMPIKQIYDTESMTIETQSFPLRSSSEALDNAAIILRLSLFLLSPESSNDSPIISPTRLPSTPGIRPVDDLSAPLANTNRSISKETPPPRSSVEEERSDRPIASNLVSVNPVARNTHSILDNRLTPDRRSLLISDDPDLKSTRYGRIQLGIRYTLDRQSLSVKVYSCKELTPVHAQQLPDPYIRLYLMPDFGKDKKKSKSIHDTLNPVYDDLFEWRASVVDIRRQHLRISIKNNSPLFAQEQTYMGELQIDLSNLDLEKSSIAWYALQEPNTSAGGMIKIKYDAPESNEHSTHF